MNLAFVPCQVCTSKVLTSSSQAVLRCRVSGEKRQAAIAAVQEVAPQRGPVITLRHSAIVKPHPKRKRSSLKNR